MGNFVHLHGHSERGSLLDACAKVKDIVAEAKAKGQDAIAITEHGTMASFVEFYNECKKQDVKAIMGSEVYVVDDQSAMSLSDEDKQGLSKDEIKELTRKRMRNNHVGLIAMNNTGLRNLFKIITDANINGFYRKPRTDWNIIEKYNEGLIILTGCMSSKFNDFISRWPKKDEIDESGKGEVIVIDDLDGAEKHLLNLKRIFGDRVYGEVQTNGSDVQKHFNKRVIELCDKHDIPIVVTNDYHYVKEEDKEIHRMWKYIERMRFKKGSQLIPFDEFQGYSTEGHYIASREEMCGQWFDHHQEDSHEITMANFEEFADNTVKLAARCNVTLNDKPVFPIYPVPDGETQISYLKKLVNDGWKRKKHKFVEDEKVYKDRLHREIEVIESMGYIGYFLVVWDALKYCRDNGIGVSLGRGSAGGSLMCYLLDIIYVDPIKYKLQFERFLNKERSKLPDIDMDICSNGRDRLIDYLKTVYGNENVSTVITFGEQSYNTLIRDVSKGFGIPFAEVNAAAKTIDSLKDAQLTWEQLKQKRKDVGAFIKKYPHVEKYIVGLHKNTRMYGTHAGAVVIADTTITDYAPLMRVSNQAGDVFYNIQVDKGLLETIGLIKFDFLGLSTVSVIDSTAKMIGMENGIYDLYELEPDDSKVYTDFCAGDNTGVFQFTGAGISGMTKAVQPKDIFDLSHCNAMYRPAVLNANVHNHFLDRRNGIQEEDYIHPEFEDILKNTHGLIIYQEQVIAILNKMGLDLGEGDVMRRNMEKVAVGKKPKKVLDDAIALMESRGFGVIDPNDAKVVIKQLMSQIGYNFNKSHSLQYSLLAYYCQYLKHYHPYEFIVCNINQANSIEKAREFIEFGKNMYVLNVIVGNINSISNSFYIKDGKMYFGLSYAKNLSSSDIEMIIEHRPYISFEDFTSKMNLGKFNRRKMETAIELGFFKDVPLVSGKTYVPKDKELFTFHKSMVEIDKNMVNLTPLETDEKYEAKLVKIIGEKCLTLKDIPKLHRKVSVAKLPSKRKKELWRDIYLRDKLATIGAFSSEEKSKIEKKYFTFNVEYDIMSELHRWEKTANHKELAKKCGLDETFHFAVVDRIKLWTDSRNNEMAFLSIRTTENVVHDVTVFASLYKVYGDNLAEGNAGVFFLREGDRGLLLSKFFRRGWTHGS